MLSLKTIFGAGWLISSRLSGRLIDVITLLVLARALSPADFGVTALAASLIAILDTALELPLSQALTRSKTVDKSHLDTAFTLGLLRGLVLSGVLLAAAWPFALLYQDERLATVVCALAIAPVARSLYSPAMVRFVREMSFRQAFSIEISGRVLAAGCAIGTANAGGGCWAIVANSVVAPLTTLALSHIIAPYRPAFSFARLAEFKGFLGWFSSAQLLAAASWQVDRGVLGYFVSKSTLGRYTMASDLSVLPTQSIIGPAMQPVMAAFSRITDEPERLAKAYLRATSFTMTIAAPAAIGISLTADLIVRVLLGEKWLESAFYLRWLALATGLSAAYQPLYSLALAMNRPVVLFRLNLLEITCKAALVALGYLALALPGVVGARGLVSLIMFLMVLLTARRLAAVPVLIQLASLWRVALASAAMALLVFLLRQELAAQHLAPALELAASVASGVLIYGAALLILGFRPGLGGAARMTLRPGAG